MANYASAVECPEELLVLRGLAYGILVSSVLWAFLVSTALAMVM